MSKKFQIIALAALIISAPLAAVAEADRDYPTELNEVQILVNGYSIRVVNASGQDYNVYNIAGIKITSGHIESNDEKLSVRLPKGCYILKVGKMVRKITIK